MPQEISKEKKLYNLGYMIQLTAAAINSTQPPEPTEDVLFDRIYKVCKHNNVANTVFYSIEKLKNKPSKELYKKWCDERNIAVHREMVQTMEAEALEAMFNENDIDFMPIKGFAVSNLYPQRDYRYMGDLDFLIKPEDLKKAGVLVKNMGYMPKMIDKFHHDEYKKPPLMVIELHHSMVSSTSRFANYYRDFMKKGKNVGGHKYLMSDEDFYIFMLVHLNKHYEEAGTGIRSFIDMYLLNEKLLPKLNRSYIDGELRKLELTEFSAFVDKICDKWFNRVDVKTLSKEELFILSSGAYGTDLHKFEQRKIGKKRSEFIRERLFPSVAWMKEDYPIVRKSIVFLPAAYVHRIIKRLIVNRKGIKKEIQAMKK